MNSQETKSRNNDDYKNASIVLMWAIVIFCLFDTNISLTNKAESIQKSIAQQNLILRDQTEDLIILGKLLHEKDDSLAIYRDALLSCSLASPQKGD